MRFIRKLRNKFVILALFCGILFANMPMDTVYAFEPMSYDSWVQDTNQYDSIYGKSNSTPKRDLGEQTNDETVGFAEFFIASLIEGLGWSMDQLINGNENFKADIDTVIRGRLKNGINVNWFSFELVDNNPFGIIGANIYKISRNAFFPLMIIVFSIIAIEWLINSDKVKGLLDIKHGIIWTVCMVLWMYIFPMITDFILYAKDAFMMYLGKGLLKGEVLDLISVFYSNLTSSYTIVSALLYCGAVAGGIYFVGNYIFTALTQTILFGFMPLVSSLSIKYRKLFSNVIATFIPNLLIAAVDFSLLLMPLLYGKLVNNYIGTSSTPLIAQFVQLLMVWSIIPTRQAVFRAFGVMIGAGNAGGGIGGMLGTMAMMSRSMGKGKRGISSGNNSGSKHSSAEDRNSARYHEQLNNTLKDDARYSNDISAHNRAAHERLEQMTSEPDKNFLDLESGMSANSHLDNINDSEIGTHSHMDTDFDAPLPTEHSELTRENEPFSDSDISSTIQSEPLNMHDNTETNFTDTMESPASPSGIGKSVDENDFVKEPNNTTAYTNSEVSLPTREDNLSDLQSAQMDYDSASATYQKEQASINDARSQIQQNEREIQNINSEVSKTPEGQYNYTPEQKARVEQLYAENNTLNDRMISHQQSMNTARKQMDGASRTLHESQRIERSYADFDRVSGGTGKTYSNVGDFQLDNSLREAQKQFINHRNFDSKQFDGVLSNEEKAKYYKQRARIGDAQSAVGVVGKMANVGITTAAVAGATFGGANAMVQSGMLGNTAGGYVTDKAMQGVNTVIDYIPEVSRAVTTAANNSTSTIENSINTVPAKKQAASSKNASYYQGQVLANEKDTVLKAQEEAIRRGGKKTNES